VEERLLHRKGLVCISEIKLAHSDDEVRREMASVQCDQQHVGRVDSEYYRAGQGDATDSLTV
jgi:hypothetical protein